MTHPALRAERARALRGGLLSYAEAQRQLERPRWRLVFAHFVMLVVQLATLARAL